MPLYRYAIDRLDQENDLVRVEIVPAVQGMTLERLKELAAQNQAESLAWWDRSGSRTKEMSLKKFAKLLCLDQSSPGRQEQDSQLAENMVFWILGTDTFFETVISATGPARALTKRLYMQALKTGQGDASS